MQAWMEIHIDLIPGTGNCLNSLTSILLLLLHS